jgi:hypothetical protein
MSNKIEVGRWQEAQEVELHDHGISSYDLKFYQNMYKNIFNFLKIDDKNIFQNKVIVEVGPAFFPCLLDIKTKKSIVIEPLFDKFEQKIKNNYYDNNIVCISLPLEQINIEDVKCDEIWIFNVMQHILDPDIFLEKAIKCSKIIRIFEPINCETNIAHPHRYTFEYFINKFNNFKHNLELYNGETILDFHLADCIYGSIEVGE